MLRKFTNCANSNLSSKYNNNSSNWVSNSWSKNFNTSIKSSSICRDWLKRLQFSYSTKINISASDCCKRSGNGSINTSTSSNINKSEGVVTK